MTPEDKQKQLRLSLDEKSSVLKNSYLNGIFSTKEKFMFLSVEEKTALFCYI